MRVRIHGHSAEAESVFLKWTEPLPPPPPLTKSFWGRKLVRQFAFEDGGTSRRSEGLTARKRMVSKANSNFAEG